jgi:hypothetical protein
MRGVFNTSWSFGPSSKSFSKLLALSQALPFLPKIEGKTVRIPKLRAKNNGLYPQKFYFLFMV